MTYATFEDYTNLYFGNVVPEADFPRLVERASEEIDILTSKRLREWLPENENDFADIKKAACALAEYIYYGDVLASAGMEGIGHEKQADGSVRGKVVTSITSGSESISFSASGFSASSLEGIAIQEMQKKSRQKTMNLLNGVRYKDKPYMITFRGVGYE